MTNKGTATFIAQRASAAFLVPLVVWFLWGAVAHAGSSYDEMRAWISAPVNAILMGLLILIGALHMRIGLNEIIEQRPKAVRGDADTGIRDRPTDIRRVLILLE